MNFKKPRRFMRRKKRMYARSKKTGREFVVYGKFTSYLHGRRIEYYKLVELSTGCEFEMPAHELEMIEEPFHDQNNRTK